MTQTAGPGLNKDSCAAALTQRARQAHLAVLAAFAETGRPPARGELERTARARGGDPAAVLAELAERDMIAFGADGEIRAGSRPGGSQAWPLNRSRRASSLLLAE